MDDDRDQPGGPRTDATDRMIDKASWAIFWFLIGGGFFYWASEIMGWE